MLFRSVRLRDLEPFHRFQRLAAFRTGGLLSYADLARDAGTSPGTARNYLEYLRLSYQAFLLPPFSGESASGLVKSPKIYWVDLGIARTLTGIHGPAPGPLFESLVVAEAQKLTRTLSLEAELSFFRSRSGLEVDFLADTPRGVLAFEIKAREQAAATDFRPLRLLAERLGKKLAAAFVVTSGGALARGPSDGPFWSVPFHRLFG